MKPVINNTQFGSITIDNHKYNQDVFINSKGDVHIRKMELSKEVTGTSHVVSADELKFIQETEISDIIIGTGQNGVMTVSEEGIKYLESVGCKYHILPTPQAMKIWNETDSISAGLFHVTC